MAERRDESKLMCIQFLCTIAESKRRKKKETRFVSKWKGRKIDTHCRTAQSHSIIDHLVSCVERWCLSPFIALHKRRVSGWDGKQIKWIETWGSEFIQQHILMQETIIINQGTLFKCSLPYCCYESRDSDSLDSKSCALL